MKDLQWIKDGYFAHRGLHTKKIPENSIPAFTSAKSHKYDIELDIRLTKDEKIVVCHDDNLKRICGIDKLVSQMNFEDLRDLKLLDSNESIPLLTEVLDAITEKTQCLIELKSTSKNKKFVTMFLKTMEHYNNQYAIHSFDPRIVSQFKKQNPKVIRGQIARFFPHKHPFRNYIVKHFVANRFTKPDFINFRFEDLPNKTVDKVYAKGMCVISYTAKSEKSLRFIKNRYDNAVFENFKPKK